MPTRSISKRAAKSEKGQQAVAQVVMNRVFSGYYPNNVCGVVYQNASRHLACQFTFACEGKDLEPHRRARHVGAGQAHRQGYARRQNLAHRSRPRHALSRLLGASELGARDDEALQSRRAHVLSAAQLGQWRRRAGLGQRTPKRTWTADPEVTDGRDPEPAPRSAGPRS